jgi:hypothetical protein
MSKVLLHDALQASYGDKKGENALKKAGYKYDSMLSSHKQKVWVNPQSKKMLFNVAGSHNIRDFVITDVALALGGLKYTPRYWSADHTLKEAKKKYAGYDTTVTGHSLGSTIGQQIASKGGGDKFYGLDGGFTIGQKLSDNKNFHNYRTAGDLVSGVASFNPNMTTLTNKGLLGIQGPLLSHNLSHIKNEQIYV